MGFWGQRKIAFYIEIAKVQLLTLKNAHYELAYTLKGLSGRISSAWKWFGFD